MSVTDFWASFEIQAFLSSLFIGLSIASIWLIAALGLTVIYGMMRVINMAHGEFIMVGGYLSYIMIAHMEIPYILCIPFSFALVAAFGLVVERVIIRRLYERPLDTLLATWGLSLIIIQSVRLIFGAQPLYIELPSWITFQFEFGFLYMSGIRVFIFVMSILLVLITWFIAYKTIWGIRIRAVMDNPDIASSFGINSSVVYSVTFAYGAGLAGVAGTLLVGLKTLLPDMGAGYIVEAFLVVVVGGTQLAGSILSALLLGELNSVFSYITNNTFARFILFTLVVIFLRFRPRGLISEDAGRR